MPVRDFVLAKPITERFISHVTDFLSLVLPGFRDEGRSRLTIGFGCTGGQHRSVAISEEIGRRLTLAGQGPVSVWHRELERS